MNFASSDKKYSYGQAKVKTFLSQQGPWLILLFIILLSMMIGCLFGFVFGYWYNAKYNQNTKSTIYSTASISKSNENLFQSASNLVDNNKINHVIKNIETIQPSQNTKNFVNFPTKNLDKEVTITIKKNDTLKKIFKKFGINEKQVNNIFILKEASVLKKIIAGRKIHFTIDNSGLFVKKLEYNIDDLNILMMKSVDSGKKWTIRFKKINPTVSSKCVTVVVNDSIYQSGKKSGIPSHIMTQISSLFNHKSSLNKIGKGDHLVISYSEYTIGNKKVSDSTIEAIELFHNGKAHRIVSFTEPNGKTNFYTPDGRSLNPSFIRYPVNFNRISDHFSSSRKHPVLGYYRPHLGVDFSAHAGSPVKAASNGQIVFVGYKGSYGKAIIIKHASYYSTLYAHLSKFSGNVYFGKNVKRNEIIGYVGSTGMSTAPHLHYEVHVNGIPKDPLKVKLPIGEMIASKYRNRFFAHTKKVLARLDFYGKGKQHNRNHKVVALSNNPNRIHY